MFHALANLLRIYQRASVTSISIEYSEKQEENFQQNLYFLEKYI